MGIPFHQDRLISPLKQVSDSFMPLIEDLSIDTV